MPTTLASGLSTEFPVTITPTPKQDVLVTNGWNYWKRWDGITSAAEEAGIRKPTNYLLQGASGLGGSLTVTSYTAGIRWVDDAGIPGDFKTGDVTLAAGETGLQHYISAAYTGTVPSRAAYLEIWRSLAGETAVLYPMLSYAVAGVEAVSPVLDIYTDAELINQTGAGMGGDFLAGADPITIVSGDGESVALGVARGKPPAHMSALVECKNRMFAAVPVDYSTGMVQVTNGSATVTGVGTAWQTEDVTYALYSGPQEYRHFRIPGDTKDYIFYATAATTGALNDQTGFSTDTYDGTSSNFARYTIHLPPDEYLKICWSYIGTSVEPESWPATFTAQCHAPGGKITALIVSGGDLYIAKQAKLYLFNFQDDPAQGEIRRRENYRGCENQRCWVEAEGGVAYILDRQGIYAWNGSQASDVSEPIQDYFRQGKINWAQSRWFRAVYDQEAATVMFFVCMQSSTYPKHALCYSLDTRSWSIYEWDFGIGAACVAKLNNRRRVLLGCEHAKIRVMDAQLDGIASDTQGTLRGTVTSSTLCQLVDTAAAFSSAVVGTIVAIVDGKGKGQSRRITAASATTLTLRDPWLDKPDTTSTYQIGGFSWEWVSTSFRYTQRSADTSRGFGMCYEPTDNSTHLFFSLYKNRNADPTPWSSGADYGDAMKRLGLTIRGNDPYARLDMRRKRHALATSRKQDYDDTGYVRMQFDNQTDVPGAADRYAAIKLHGNQGPSPVKIYRLTIDGVRV